MYIHIINTFAWLCSKYIAFKEVSCTKCNMHNLEKKNIDKRNILLKGSSVLPYSKKELIDLKSGSH